MKYRVKIVEEVESGLLPSKMAEVYIKNELNEEEVIKRLAKLNSKFIFYPGKYIKETDEIKLPGLWMVDSRVCFKEENKRVVNEDELEEMISNFKL